MRRVGLLTGIAAVAALAAVGCAGRPPVSAGAPPSVITSAPAPTTNAPNLRPPVGSVPVAAAQVDARDLPAGYPRLVWTDGNGSVVGFFAEVGACTTAGASVIGQTDAAVTVRLLITRAASTKPCPEYLLIKQMTVNLDRPLGSRTVIMQAVIERG